MHFLTSILLLLFVSSVSFSQTKKTTSPPSKPKEESYFYIRSTFPQYKNEYAFLASYYADDKKYLADSALIGNDHKATFKVKKSVSGGIYMIVFPQKNNFVDILINGNKDFQVFLDTTRIPLNVTFKNSPENTAFYDYQKMMASMQDQFEQLASDTSKRQQLNDFKNNVNSYIRHFKDSVSRALPESMLEKIFLLSDMPELPKSLDSATPLQKYTYAKQHFWDGLSFNDKRLLFTPLIRRKMDTYFETMVHPAPDSIVKDATHILDQVNRKDSVLFSFYLNYLLVRFGNSKIMGHDKIFVKIFERYVLDKKPEWMSESAYSQMKRSYYMLIDNLIGNFADNIKLLSQTDKPFTLYDVKAKYTVLIFWDPTCSHCKATVPIVDSMLQHKWKGKDIAVVGVYIDGGIDAWKKMITEKKLTDWVHGYQTQAMQDELYKANRPSIFQSYNISATPVIYLLDNQKKILAKNLDIYNVDRIIELSEKDTPKR